MIFVDQLKRAISIMVKPGQSTKQPASIGQSLKFYYLATFIPAIIAIILVAVVFVAVWRFPLLSFLGTLAGIWIIAPIGFFIGAGWLHLFGKFLLKTFKGNYTNTFTAVVYTYMPYVVLFWLTTLLSVTIGLLWRAGFGPITTATALTSILSIIIGIWSFIISLFALSNQNSTTKLKVFATQIVAAIPIVIVVVIAVLFSFGFFGSGGPNANLGTSCIGQPGFSCSSVGISTTGTISFVLGQGTGSTEYNVSLSCVSASDATSPDSLKYTPIASLGSGGSSTISNAEQITIVGLQCYSSNGPSNLAPIGTPFVGYLWMSYSSSPTAPAMFVKVATVSARSSS